MERIRTVGLIVSLLGLAASARADTVTFWNAVTVEAVSAGRPGGPGFLDVALVHAAMHDAMTTILEGFFGTNDVAFSVATEVPLATQKTRTYKRFSDAAAEVVEARILLGIHLRFADTVARTQGTHVAEWTFKCILRPVTK
jgi:hypothetical protein